MEKLFKAFLRTKHFTKAEVDESQLKRCLSTFDLTAIGVGCALGAGVYVVTGEVARAQAGPAIVISFLIAAVASLLSGLCYAEFGARVPKAGSAYIYSYVTIGELCAFVIGWNMLLEYIMGAAAVGKAWSDFFNSLCDNCIKNFFIDNIGSLKLSWLGEYPDFLAFSFIMVLTVVLIFGAAESSALNSLFTVLSLAVILFVTIAGLVFAEPKNWDNFAPFGFDGVMSGAATCFFAFVGFDVIATSGEEAKNPRKSIPRATMAALLIIFLAYECLSVTLTLMMPYNKLPKSSALATTFELRGFPAAKYIVAVGAICGLSASALAGIFPIPRILYAMASDRLIFSFFAKVNERTGTPIIACAVSGLFTALLAMLLNLVALAEMLSIGTLLSYTIVTIGVVLLRYKPGSVVEDSVNDESGDEEAAFEMADSFKPDSGDSKIENTSTRTRPDESKVKKNDTLDDPLDESNSELNRIIKRFIGQPPNEPNEASYFVVKITLGVFISATVAIQSCLVWGMHRIASKDPLIILLVVIFLILILLSCCAMARQPESDTELMFKVPFLPFLPMAAIFVNVFLLLELKALTWIRFAVWMTVGMAIYLFYGVPNSTQNEVIEKNNGAGYTKLSNVVEH